MLHLIPENSPQPRPEPYAEAVARLSTVRHALRLVDPYGGGPASDIEDDAIANAFEQADDARRTSFDTRSSKLVGATAAGVEALLDEKQKGREPHEEANRFLVDQIRRELADVAKHIFR